MKSKEIIIALGILGLAGCATTRNNTDLETQNTRGRVNELEAQLQEKDRQIAALQEALSQGAHAEMQVVPGVSLKDIQIAIKNAGYDPGKLDGVMGRKTRKAIKDFQKANGLSVTGKVGAETWLLLQQYLHKKVK